MNLLKGRKFGGHGTIARKTDRGFGFIAREDGKDLFFHSNELVDVTFSEIHAGDAIAFDIVATPKGLVAVNVSRDTRSEENQTTNEPDEIDTEDIPNEGEIVDTPDQGEVVSDEDGDPESVMRAAVKLFCSNMAESIVRDPEVLEKLEWRDLERLVAEIFSGLGFDVLLTQGSKDGGKDVIVSYLASSGHRKYYFLEIKHWRSGKRVGRKTVIEFIHVVAREQNAGGVLLATYGFAENAIERITEIDRRMIGLGTGTKIIGLCRDYVKASEGTWYPPEQLDKVIFEYTM